MTDVNWYLRPTTSTKDHLHIPFHGNTGDQLGVRGRYLGVDFEETFTVQGDVTNLWQSDGAVPNGIDNTCSLKSSPNVSGIVAPGSRAGMLFLCSTTSTRGVTPNSATHTIFKANQIGTLGGYQFAAIDGTNFNLNKTMRYVGGGDAAIPSMNATDTLGLDSPFWCYYDFNTIWRASRGGTPYLTGNRGFDSSSGSQFSTIGASQDITVFSGFTSGPTPAVFCNSAGNSVSIHIHDLWIIPFDVIPTTKEIYSIVSEYGKYPYERVQL